MLTRLSLATLFLLAAFSLSLFQFARGAAAGAAPGPHAFQLSDYVWVEDSVPAGAQLVGTWNWIGPYSFPTPAVGLDAHRDNLASGVHQHYFYKDFDTSTPAKDPGTKHGVREVSMPLPTSGKLYHIRLRPDGPPQCLSGPGCQ